MKTKPNNLKGLFKKAIKLGATKTFQIIKQETRMYKIKKNQKQKQ